MCGALIVVEGPDYVGKTTTVKAVSDRLTAMTIPHIVCREPGGTPFAEGQRNLILHGEESPAASAEIFAFLAAKADLLYKVIYPALCEDKLVLCDRYTRSLLAYQGGIRGHAYDDLIRLLAHGRVLTMPHLEILLEANVEVRGRRRAMRQGTDLMEEAAEHAAQLLAQGYKDASRYLFAQRTLSFDTSDTTVEDIAANVTTAIVHYLKFHDIIRPAFTPITYDEWQERIIERREKEKEEASADAVGTGDNHATSEAALS